MMDKIEKKLDKIIEILYGHSKKHESHTEMFESHTRMLENHTKTLEKHTRILDSHTKILNEHTKLLKTHEERLDGHDDLLDLIARTVLEHSERLDCIEIQVKKIDNLPTRKDLDKLFARLDKQIGRAGAIEQERVMMNSAIRRHGDGIESNKKDIKRIKMHLALD